MNAEEKLQMLMKRGYNLHIECKSAHRVYALTYQAQAYRKGVVTLALAVGNTLDELADNLTAELKQYDSEHWNQSEEETK